MGPNFGVGSRHVSTRNRNVATGPTTWKTPTIWNGPVLRTKIQHWKFTMLAQIMYLSWNRIMIWSVRRLFSDSRYFTSHFQICDWTNIRWVAIDHPAMSPKTSRHFTAILWILVWSQIWQREVKKRLKLHNLRTDQVMIWPELKYLSRANIARTVKLNHCPGTIWLRIIGLRPVRVTTPRRQTGSGFWPGLEPNWNGLLVNSWTGPVANTTPNWFHRIESMLLFALGCC